MATCSTITVQHEDGSYTQIYCHFDGYPSHHMPILTEFYYSQELAELLVSFGDISVLDERCVPTGDHSFDAPEAGCTIYYGRDRGEDDTAARKFETAIDLRLNGMQEEYNYIFTNKTWIVR